MPDTDSIWVQLACPHCGSVQAVSREGISGTCVKCYKHMRIRELLNPQVKVETRLPTMTVRCLDCRTEITVAPDAQSCWCPTCSKHRDLSDQTITGTVCKHVRTLGTLTLEKTGRLINSKTTVGHARLRGKFEGTLHVEGVLEIAKTAAIKGKLLHVGTLKTLPGSEFLWPEPLELAHADLDGTVQCNLTARGVVRLRAGCRFLGDIRAGGLSLEDGATLTGMVRTGEDWM